MKNKIWDMSKVTSIKTRESLIILNVLKGISRLRRYTQAALGISGFPCQIGWWSW